MFIVKYRVPGGMEKRVEKPSLIEACRFASFAVPACAKVSIEESIVIVEGPTLDQLLDGMRGRL